MRTSNITCFTLALAGVLVLGCNSKGANQGNDTQFGDDDGGEGESGGEHPQQVPDHGLAQYCVDRYAYNASVHQDLWASLNADKVSIHERWWSPPTRQYVNWLDISDKPSPATVPPLCGAIDPVWTAATGDEDAWDDSGTSCLVSGYHVSLPSIIPPDDGVYQWPYETDLITGTIGNPPEAGRHTWMAEPCCATPLTTEEITAWSHPPLTEFLYGNINGDCAVHAQYKGVHADVVGYIAPYDPPERIARTGLSSACVNNHVTYNPALLAPYKAASLGQWLPFHSTKKQNAAPLNLNFEWIASWGLIDWEDFAAFGATIDAVVQALLSVLYLPPDDFVHPRYGGGSGCAYSVALKYQVSSWQARITCPYGYYASLPDFDQYDLDTQIDGVVGRCIIDGVGSGEHGDGSGPVVLASDQAGHSHLYYVSDLDAIGDIFDGLTVTDGTTLEVNETLASLLVDELDRPLLQAGDAIEWWSTAGRVDGSLREALERTLGYDVADLAHAMGWSLEDAQRWADAAPPVPLSELLDAELPLELSTRRGNDLRARNTLTLRIARLDGRVVTVHLRAA